MTFPTNELEEVLLAASRNETGVQSFLEKLVTADLLVPSRAADDGGTSLDIVSLDNRAYVTVFTSSEQAAAAGATGELVTAPARELLDLIPEHVGFAVNPGGELGLPVYAETLRQIVNGSTRISAGARVRIGEPAEEPTALLEALTAAFESVSSIRAARRCWAMVGDDAPGLVLGIDVDPDSPDTRAAVLDAVGRTASAAATTFTVDSVFTNDRDEFTTWMQANAQPFFARD